jgi:hypothetical protein
MALAWWAAFLATLALVALLGLAKSAQALTVPAPQSFALATALAPPFEEEDEDETEAGSSDDEEFEFEDCEADEEPGEDECDEGGSAPAECQLSDAEASVSASPNRDRVSLKVRYATAAPTAVSLDYGLHGAKGSLFLGATKKKLGKQGILRLTRTLTEAQMTKVLAAKGFTVRLRVPGTPGYCQAFFDHQLDVRRATPSGLTWLQSE